jgi:hypothetical protein
MLIQQLRQMERDGMVRRIVHHQVPPKVEDALTDWGQALCPALDALLKWGRCARKWPMVPPLRARSDVLFEDRQGTLTPCPHQPNRDQQMAIRP